MRGVFFELRKVKNLHGAMLITYAKSRRNPVVREAAVQWTDIMGSALGRSPAWAFDACT
jgi:hypothetical protein